MPHERERGSARQRGYSTKWDKACQTFKARHPYCLGCQAIGKRTPTDLVDHVIPHKGDQAIFWDTASWQPSCRYHHDVIKAQLERMFEAGEIKPAELWLNSATAIALTKRRPAPQAIALDGWPLT